MALTTARVPLPLLAALALTAAAHAPGLRAGFVQDDLAVVAASPVVARGSLPEIVRSSWWAGFPLQDDRALWRPVTVASYALERRLTGEPSASLAHAVNIALHLGACAALYALARNLGAESFVAASAAAVFGVLPVRAEAVYSVVGRADVLAGLFTLAAALLFRKRSSRAAAWGAGACVAAAIGSKETGIAAIAVLAAIDAIDDQSWHGWRRWLPVLAFAALAIVARTWALEGFFPQPALPPMDNPIAALAPGPRIGSALALIPRYAMLLLAPIHLSIDYSGSSVELVSGPWNSLALLGVAILGAWVALIAVPRLRPTAGTSWRMAAVGAALVVFPYLVVSNLFRPIGVALAERLLYLPAAGVALAGCAGIGALRRRPVAIALVVAVALAGAGRTFARGFDWTDSRTAFAAARRATPSSPRPWYAVARIDADALASPAAEPAAAARIVADLDRALALWDDYPVAWHLKGRLLASGGDLAAAEPCLRAALDRRPGYADAWVDLGLVRQRRGDRDEATRAFRKAVLFDPSQDRGWASLGNLALEARSYERAIEFYQRAIALGRADLTARLAEARDRAGGAGSTP